MKRMGKLAALAVTVERGTWRPNPIFGLIADLGGVEQLDLEATLNLGIGMIAIVAESSTTTALELLARRNVPAWVCGKVRGRAVGETGDAPAKGGGGGVVRLTGKHQVD